MPKVLQKPNIKLKKMKVVVINLVIYNLWQIAGLFISFLGATLLVITEIKDRKTIELLSGTYVEENPHLKKNLELRSKLAIISTVLLAGGFIIQLIGLLISG